MTVLSGHPTVPTCKVNKIYFNMQSLRCEDLKMYEGLKSVLKYAKESY